MKKIKQLYHESCFANIFYLLINRFIPYIVTSFFESGFFYLWCVFERKIINSKPVRFFFDTAYLAEICYKSNIYKRISQITYFISNKFNKAFLCYDCIYVAAFLAFILLAPEKIWSTLVWMPIFISLALFYISHNIKEKNGTVFFVINCFLMLFIALLELSFPYRAVTALIYMLMGIDLFFLISFSIKSMADLEKILITLFVICALNCGIGVVQNAVFGISAHSIFGDGVSLGEAIVLIFPFAITYPMEFVDRKRKYAYVGFIFILAINAVTSTRSAAAYIGFLIEIAILLIANKKYAPFIVILMPMGLGSFVDNLHKTITNVTTHGNIINNIINLFQKFWKSGFGVSYKKFLSIYNSTNPNYEGNGLFFDFTHTNISPVYINFFIDVGAVIMVLFLVYILKVAHSALTYQVIGDKKYKKFFSAGFATLAALSVSSFFETTVFGSRTMLLYWAMLGILRGVRSMSLAEEK